MQPAPAFTGSPTHASLCSMAASGPSPRHGCPGLLLSVLHTPLKAGVALSALSSSSCDHLQPASSRPVLKAHALRAGHLWFSLDLLILSSPLPAPDCHCPPRPTMLSQFCQAAAALPPRPGRVSQLLLPIYPSPLLELPESVFQMAVTNIHHKQWGKSVYSHVHAKAKLPTNLRVTPTNGKIIESWLFSYYWIFSSLMKGFQQPRWENPEDFSRAILKGTCLISLSNLLSHWPTKYRRNINMYKGTSFNTSPRSCKCFDPLFSIV